MVFLPHGAVNSAKTSLLSIVFVSLVSSEDSAFDGEKGASLPLLLWAVPTVVDLKCFVFEA